MNKVFDSPEEAIWDIEDGASVIIGGPGTPTASPTSLIRALRDKGSKNLMIICNTVGFSPYAAIVLVENRQVNRLRAAFGGIARLPTATEEQIKAGEIDFELIPQGTLCERLRAGAAGIAGIYTPTGVGTVVETGKEKRTFGDREYLLETALRADFALIPAHKADTMGNVVFRRSGHNFNPVFIAAAKTSIVEAEEVVETGELDPESIDISGIYVDRVVKSTFDRHRAKDEWRPMLARALMLGAPIERGSKTGLSRELIALRASKELMPGDWVNLGIGIPTIVSLFLPEGVNLHAEIGILANGPPPKPDEEVDIDTWGASAEWLTVKPGTSFCSNLEAFAMARVGRVATVILGAFQVSEKGDLANVWSPEMGAPGVGGAMDLVAGKARVIILMEHTTKDNKPRILKECSYPLTGIRCVSLIITDLAVIEVTPQGLVLNELAPGWTAEEIQALTEPELIVNPELKEMEL